METVFLACFIFGALFTLASLVLGAGDHGLAHLPHAHAHLPHAHAGSHSANTDNEAIPWFSASSVVGALTWFGATGFVLERLGDWALPVVLAIAIATGAVGWYLVARFLGLVLQGERVMDPADYRLEGTVGNITISIPSGGTGEIVFSKAGARRSEAARAFGNAAIPRGTEVVITSYADGFATVQPWDEFVASRDRVAALEKNKA